MCLLPVYLIIAIIKVIPVGGMAGMASDSTLGAGPCTLRSMGVSMDMVPIMGMIAGVECGVGMFLMGPPVTGEC